MQDTWKTMFEEEEILTRGPGGRSERWRKPLRRERKLEYQTSVMPAKGGDRLWRVGE